MDDRDRHIITFGSDEPDNDYYEDDYYGDIAGNDVVENYIEGGSTAAGSPAAEDHSSAVSGEVSASAGFAAHNDFSMDVDIPQDVEAETHTYSTGQSDTYAGSDRQDTYHYEEPEEEEAEPVSAEYTQPLNVRPVNDRRYVTKGALALCMVITMLVSSVLGAFLGTTFLRGKVSEDTPSRDDSELSQLSLSDATNSELTISEIVNKNENAVVEILVSATTQNFFGQQQVTEGAGSGVIVNSNGYIVTNYHVIEGANKVQVTLHNGETYPASIVGGVNESDIAVIKINAQDLTTAEIGDSDTINVGDTAVAIGNPLGQLGGTATSGIISALDRTLNIDGRTLRLIQTDAAINGGNSGGGLFNSKGELIGIVDAKSSGVGIEGLAFAIPINSVVDVINDLVENGKVSVKPVIGITIQDVSEENAQYYNLEAAGVYVAQVTGENARRAGFQQGDRIVSFNGKEISSSSDLISKVRECKAGDTVSVVVSRSGQQIEIKTVLEEAATQQ